MSEKYKIDKLDKEILSYLQSDVRQSFKGIARELSVSIGTVRGRYNKLCDLGIVKGSNLKLNYEKLGYDIFAFVGINLHKAGDYKKVIKEMENIPEILEAHYTTGKYNIFLIIVAKSTKGLKNLLIDKLQGIKEVQSTETLISLDIAFARSFDIFNIGG
jgi:Lrp/AsnC family transcriptional regulator for asnA, asnC and gidA